MGMLKPCTSSKRKIYLKPRYESHTIEIWKEDLIKVTGRDGFELKTYDGDKEQLVDNVMREADKTKVKAMKQNILIEQR